MVKLAPARVSNRDDFVILYHVYMMTGSIHTMFTWKLNQNCKHAVHSQRHVFRYCCSSGCFSHKFVKFVYEPYVEQAYQPEKQPGASISSRKLSNNTLRHKLFKKRPRKKKHFWIKPTRTDLWGCNMKEDRCLEEDWKKNFRMSKAKFLKLVEEL